MIDARIEENILQQVLGEERLLHVLGEAAVAPPVEGDGAAPVGDHEPELGKVLEEVALQQLHERRGVAVEVMGARVVHRRVARRRHVDHRRHLELDQLLVDRVPVAVGEGWGLPVAARGIGIQVHAHEAELVHKAHELRDRAFDGRTGKLRQLTDWRKVLGKQRADAVDQVVAHTRPLLADLLGADVVRHARGARREYREVAATILLQLELRRHALDQRRVADAQVGGGGLARGIRDAGELLVAEGLQRQRLGGVVTVDVDDHRAAAPSRNCMMRAGALPSACSATGTSQYSERGRHSSR